MSTTKERRKFWIYQNEADGETFCCDYNQRGFVPENAVNPLSAISFDPKTEVILSRETLNKFISGFREVASDRTLSMWIVNAYDEVRESLEISEGTGEG